MSEIKKIDEEQLEQVVGGGVPYDVSQFEIYHDSIGTETEIFDAEQNMRDPSFPLSITW